MIVDIRLGPLLTYTIFTNHLMLKLLLGPPTGLKIFHFAFRWRKSFNQN